MNGAARWATAWLAAFFLAVVPSADASERRIAWAGMGMANCRLVVDLYQSEPEQTRLYFLSWAQGFMSVLNSMFFWKIDQQANLKQLDLDTNQQWALLYEFCEGTPDSLFVEGVLNLYDKMRDEQKLTDWRFFSVRPN